MPIDAPPAKIDATRRHGADVMLSDHGAQNREVVAADLARSTAMERGMTLLRPFDDPGIVAGQASVGIELLERGFLVQGDDASWSQGKAREYSLTVLPIIGHEPTDECRNWRPGKPVVPTHRGHRKKLNMSPNFEPDRSQICTGSPENRPESPTDPKST